MINAQISIHPSKDTWPAEFAALGAQLRSALGASALRIDHIGSTAVPNLDAKDVIDIQVTVADLAPIGPLLDASGFMSRAGIRYDHTPLKMMLPPEELAKLLYHPGAGRRANIHVRVAGRFNQRYPLLCRDYLRTHPEAAAAYAQIKRQLARYFPNDVDAYYNVKDPVFDLIMVGAEAWARATDWQPGATDA